MKYDQVLYIGGFLPTGVVTMWPREADGQLQLLKHPQRGGAGVIGCVVQDDQAVVPPVWLLLIQLPCQRPEVDLHDLGVGVSLDEAEVDLPIRVHSGDHCDPWGDWQLDHRVSGTGGLPLPPPEVTHTQPCLIHVDTPLTLPERLQHP